MMSNPIEQAGRLVVTLLLALLVSTATEADHDIRGITGPTFNLYASSFYVTLPDASGLYMWGYGDEGAGATATHPEGNGYSLPQYPGPTLIVTEGDTVTVNLKNYGVPDSLATATGPVANPVSIVVAGHRVSATGGTPDLVTNGARIGETVTYTFTAGKPGTYLYHSLGGPSPGLHAEMGLFGALLVRPIDGSRSAHGTGTGTDYEQEFLVLLSEADPSIHAEMEREHYSHFTHHDRDATLWFVNGRAFPDLLGGNYNPVYPNQPYESLAQSHPGDRVLVRTVNAGHDSHPFHFDGEELRLVGRDGAMLSSDGLAADLGRADHTLSSAPKQTVDAIWRWTGKDLGWDIYGPVSANCSDANHDMIGDGGAATCHDNNCVDLVDNATGVAPPDGFDDVNHEYCPDHGRPFPVALPTVGEMTMGRWWSGSPYLGDVGDLPPGEGGLNPFGGFFLPWHSHAMKELTTNNTYPGGSLSMMLVLPAGVAIQ
jgi:hypothetical protein